MQHPIIGELQLHVHHPLSFHVLVGNKKYVSNKTSTIIVLTPMQTTPSPVKSMMEY